MAYGVITARIQTPLTKVMSVLTEQLSTLLSTQATNVHPDDNCYLVLTMRVSIQATTPHIHDKLQTANSCDQTRAKC